jgi:RNA polymerase sigma-70 factor (sigma-E family)
MGSLASDTGAWERLGMGDTRAESEFVEFVRARQPRLLGFAYLLSGDRHTAEDLVQSALAKTFLSWDRLRDLNALDAYVRRVIVNEHNSLWRRPWKRREHPSAELPESRSADRHDVETNDALWRLVRSLPSRQRAAVVLRYYEDLTEADTAEVLGCSVGTVKSQTSRALETMRNQVAEDPGLLGGESHG